MAEEMKQELSAEEAEQLALVENDRDALSALVDDLSGHSRRKRQMAAHVMLLVAQREPELLSEFIPDLIDALYRPEAQTRWEILDALTLLVPEHAKEIGAAFDGNWESLSGDINFDNNLQRCIAVDIRYVLFIIDKLGGCKHLIDEMTIVE